MIKNITVVTSNPGKVESIRSMLPKSFEVCGEYLDLTEIQANSAEEVSIAKAKEAFKILKKPLLVQDSSFHLNAFNGFPGVYIKYVLETLGIEGIVDLLKDKSDRSYYFEGALTYIYGENEYKTFIARSNPGTVVKEIKLNKNERAWGKLWQIVVPHNQKKTLSEMSAEEIKLKVDHISEFQMFAEWISKQ